MIFTQLFWTRVTLFLLAVALMLCIAGFPTRALVLIASAWVARCVGSDLDIRR